MTDIVAALTSKHPHYEAMADSWARYRAFGGGLVSDAAKKDWLPQGRNEHNDDYAMRLKLSHDMGWSAAAIRRIAGTLTKEPATLTLDDSELPSAVKDQLEEWRTSVDGNGRDADSWWGDMVPEALRMGTAPIEVCRDSTMGEEGESPTPDGLPYLCHWEPEEVINWSHDKRGALEWVVLHRKETVQSNPKDAPGTREVVRILWRDRGEQWSISTDTATGQKSAEMTDEWAHGLGVVPFNPHFAHRLTEMIGRSYIDQISLGDWRKLQLESDQAMASYLHGSPWLVIKSQKKLEEVVPGSNRAMHLDGSADEDAFYLSLDAAGMEIREKIIERTALESLNSAGIDPAGVATSEGVTSRSGVSLALTFSTTEEPTLNSLVEEMDTTDVALLEIVTRYLTDGDLPGPHERLFDGSITRTKAWDLMSVDEQVGLTVDGGHAIKSATWHRENAKRLAKRVNPDLDADILDAINREIEDADYSPQPPVMSGMSLGDEPGTAADEAGDLNEQPTEKEDSNV